MAEMPTGLSAAEIESVEASGEEWLATIRYVGSGGHLRVESRWAERDGRPKIVDLKAL